MFLHDKQQLHVYVTANHLMELDASTEVSSYVVIECTGLSLVAIDTPQYTCAKHMYVCYGCTGAP